MKDTKRSLKSWKANLEIWQSRNDTEMVDFAEGVIFGLELALNSTEKPCNTQMHMDTKPCEKWHDVYKNIKHYKFCIDCGIRL